MPRLSVLLVILVSYIAKKHKISIEVFDTAGNAIDVPADGCNTGRGFWWTDDTAKRNWSYGWPYDRRPSYGHLRTGRRMAKDLWYPLYDQLMAMFK